MTNKNQITTVHISTISVLKIIAIILVLWFLYLIRGVLAVVFISFVFASALEPLVNWLQGRKVPRPFGILIIYLVIALVLALIILLIVPPLTEQIKQIAANFPDVYQRVMDFLIRTQVTTQEGIKSGLEGALESLSQALTTFGRGIFATAAGFFGGLISVIGVLVITFYMVLRKDATQNFLKTFSPARFQSYIVQLSVRIQEKMGLWLRGQLILCVIIGIMSFIGLSILRVKFALLLGLIAGITEFVPTLGPIIGAVPAILIALTQSPLKALLVLILYLIIQQVENSVIVPKVMQKSVGLNPIVIIVVMLIGARLGGIAGMIIAVPSATIIYLFIQDFLEMRKMRAGKI